MALLVAMLGLATLVDGWRHRWPGGRRQATSGATLVVIGAAWFLVAVTVVIPAAIGRGATESPFVSRYGQNGDSLTGLVRTVLTRPDIVWSVTPKRQVADYWLTLALGGGLTPLLSPLTLLAAPELAINSLSSFASQRAVATHYSLGAVLFVIAGAASGAAWLARSAAAWSSHRRLPAAQAGTLISMLLVAGGQAVDRGFLPGARLQRVDSPTARQATAAALFARIPPDAPLTVSANLLPHRSHRRWVYPFAYGFTPPRVATDPAPEWVLLDVADAEERLDGRSLEREVYLAPDLGVVAAADGYLLLRRGLTDKTLPPEFTRFALADPDVVSQPDPTTSAAGPGRTRL